MDEQDTVLLDTALDRHLIERRTVFLRGMISRELADSTRERLLLLQSISSDPIHLLIDSGGGSIVYALRIGDFISNILAAPVRGVVIGDCFSAATLVLLHCTQRVCTPNATFLTHSSTQVIEVTLRVDRNVKGDIQLMYRDVIRTKNMMVRVYMSKLGLTRAKVKELIKRGDQKFDDQMHAEEALKLGLVEEIITEKLDIFDSHIMSE